MLDVFELTDEDFSFIQDLTYQHIGVNLTEAKRPLLVSRLSKRLKSLGLSSFKEYRVRLQEHPEELEVMANLLTTNVTYFFREDHHFNFLKEEVLPHIEERSDQQCHPPKIKGWSAGCSTGEEAYSTAIVLDDYFRNRRGWDYKILASDINTQVLEEARKGIYPEEKVKNVPRAMLQRYFKAGTGENTGMFQVKDFLRARVIFTRINLSREEEYPKVEDLDFIFCRNVFIYFDQESQEKILHSFAKRLRPGGHLFLGHSETIDRRFQGGNPWRLVSHTVYRKEA